MRIANANVVIPDHPVMKYAQTVAEKIWIANGRPEGITITAGKNGVHGPGSWHNYGAAVDLRTHYDDRQIYESGAMADYPEDSLNWDDLDRTDVLAELKDALPEYDIIMHSTHIHCEPGDVLARKWGLLL